MCTKPNPVVCLLINTLLVLAVFMAADYLVYFLMYSSSNPFGMMLGTKLFYTFLMAVSYAVIYDKASYMWQPGSQKAFLPYAYVAGKECNPSLLKVLNGMIFSLLSSLLILMCIALSAVFISYIYMYVLHGFHGQPPPRDVYDVGGKLILAGIVLEIGGKTGSDGHM